MSSQIVSHLQNVLSALPIPPVTQQSIVSSLTDLAYDIIQNIPNVDNAKQQQVDYQKVTGLKKINNTKTATLDAYTTSLDFIHNTSIAEIGTKLTQSTNANIVASNNGELDVNAALFPELTSYYDLSKIYTTQSKPTSINVTKASRAIHYSAETNVAWILTPQGIVGVDMTTLVESQYNHSYSVSMVQPLFMATSTTSAEKSPRVDLSLYNNIIVNPPGTMAVVWSTINTELYPIIVNLPTHLQTLSLNDLNQAKQQQKESNNLENSDDLTQSAIQVLNASAIIASLDNRQVKLIGKNGKKNKRFIGNNKNDESAAFEIQDIQFHALSSHTLLVLTAQNVLITFTLYSNQYLHTTPPPYLQDVAIPDELFLTATPTTIYDLNTLPHCNFDALNNNNNTTNMNTTTLHQYQPDLTHNWVKMLYLPAIVQKPLFDQAANKNNIIGEANTKPNIFDFPQLSFSYGLLASDGTFAVLSPIIPHMFTAPTDVVLNYRQHIVINAFPELFAKIQNTPHYKEILTKLTPSQRLCHDQYIMQYNVAQTRPQKGKMGNLAIQKSWLSFLLQFDTMFGLAPKNPFDPSINIPVLQYQQRFVRTLADQSIGAAMNKMTNYIDILNYLTLDVPITEFLTTDVYTKLSHSITSSMIGSGNSNIQTERLPILQIYTNFKNQQTFNNNNNNLQQYPSTFTDCVLIPNHFNLPIIACSELISLPPSPVDRSPYYKSIYYSLLSTTINNITHFGSNPMLYPIIQRLVSDHSYDWYVETYRPTILNALKSEYNTQIHTDSLYKPYVTRMKRITTTLSVDIAGIDGSTDGCINKKTILYIGGMTSTKNDYSYEHSNNFANLINKASPDGRNVDSFYFNLIQLDNAKDLKYRLPTDYYSNVTTKAIVDRSFYAALYMAQLKTTEAELETTSTSSSTTTGKKNGLDFSFDMASRDNFGVTSNNNQNVEMPDNLTPYEQIWWNVKQCFTEHTINEQTLPQYQNIMKYNEKQLQFYNQQRQQQLQTSSLPSNNISDLKTTGNVNITTKIEYCFLTEVVKEVIKHLRRRQLSNTIVSTDLSSINRYYYNNVNNTNNNNNNSVNSLFSKSNQNNNLFNCMILPTLTTQTNITLHSLALFLTPDLLRGVISRVAQGPEFKQFNFSNLVNNNNTTTNNNNNNFDYLLKLLIYMLLFTLSDITNNIFSESRIFSYSNIIDTDRIITLLFAINNLQKFDNASTKNIILNNLNNTQSKTYFDVIGLSQGCTAITSPYHNMRLVQYKKLLQYANLNNNNNNMDTQDININNITASMSGLFTTPAEEFKTKTFLEQQLYTMLTGYYRISALPVTLGLSRLFNGLQRLEETNIQLAQIANHNNQNNNDNDENWDEQNATLISRLNKSTNTPLEATKFALYLTQTYNPISAKPLNYEITTIPLPAPILYLIQQFYEEQNEKQKQEIEKQNKNKPTPTTLPEEQTNRLNQQLFDQLEQINDEFSHAITNFANLETTYLTNYQKSTTNPDDNTNEIKTTTNLFNINNPTPPITNISANKNSNHISTVAKRLDTVVFLDKYNIIDGIPTKPASATTSTNNINTNPLYELNQLLINTPAAMTDSYFKQINDLVKNIELDCEDIKLQLHIKVDILAEISMKTYDYSQYLLKYFLLLNTSYESYRGFYDKIVEKQKLLRSKLSRIQERLLNVTVGNTASPSNNNNGNDNNQQEQQVFLPTTLHTTLRQLTGELDNLTQQIAQFKDREQRLVEQQAQLFGIGIKPTQFTTTTPEKLLEVVSEIVKLHSALNSYALRLKPHD